jgi:hypothetical protein
LIFILIVSRQSVNGRDLLVTNLTFLLVLQVEDPLKNRQYFRQAVSSEDYSFTAHTDGKYVYCFSNEGWTSNSKEVSFNVHGIVYVPEHELAQDPLEAEGMSIAYGRWTQVVRCQLTASLQCVNSRRLWLR